MNGRIFVHVYNVMLRLHGLYKRLNRVSLPLILAFMSYHSLLHMLNATGSPGPRFGPRARCTCLTAGAFCAAAACCICAHSSDLNSSLERQTLDSLGRIRDSSSSSCAMYFCAKGCRCSVTGPACFHPIPELVYASSLTVSSFGTKGQGILLLFSLHLERFSLLLLQVS